VQGTRAPAARLDSIRAGDSDGHATDEISLADSRPLAPSGGRATARRGSGSGALPGSGPPVSSGRRQGGTPGSPARGPRPEATSRLEGNATGGALATSSGGRQAPPAPAPPVLPGPRRRAHLPRPSRLPAASSTGGGATETPCRCRQPRRGRAHTNGRGGFDLPADPHAVARTLAAPPPPVNKMPVFGNDAVGIPPDRVLFVRSIVRAAVKEYFTSYLTWGYQHSQDMEQAITYVELHEPRLAACVRSWGACALLSRAINNKAAHVHARCCSEDAPALSTPSLALGGTSPSRVGASADTVCPARAGTRADATSTGSMPGRSPTGTAGAGQVITGLAVGASPDARVMGGGGGGDGIRDRGGAGGHAGATRRGDAPATRTAEDFFVSISR